MKLLGKNLLLHFKKKHAEAHSQIDAWQAELEEVQWQSPHDLKKKYPKASVLGDQQVIFNICRNKYRIWVQINYKNGIILIKERYVI